MAHKRKGIDRNSHISEETVIVLGDVLQRSSAKVIVVGDRGSGKTSLITSLITGKHGTVDTPTRDIEQYIWQPFVDNQSYIPEINIQNNKSLALDILDTSGREVIQKLCSVFYPTYAVFIIVFDISETSSCANVVPAIKRIQQRVLESDIMLVATHSDQLNDLHCETRKNDVLKNLAKQQDHWDRALIDCLDSYRCSTDDGLGKHYKDTFQKLSERQTKLPNNVYLVSSINGKGLLEFSAALIERASHNTNQIYSDSLCIESSYEKISNLCEEGKLFYELNNVATTSEEATFSPQELSALNMRGHILLLHGPGEKPIDVRSCTDVCLYPVRLIKAVCSLHFDLNATFEIESSRFWPPKSSHRPSASEVAAFLEEIPTMGRVRDVLLPIIWQEFAFSECEIVKLRDILISHGLMTPAERIAASVDDIQLTLLNYPGLAWDIAYRLPAADLLPLKKPALHWSPYPLPDDIQLVWQYTFPYGIPKDLLGWAIARCMSVSDGSWYRHIWKEGLLIATNEMTLHMRHREDRIAVYCRMIVDGDVDLVEEIQHMWIHLAQFVIRLQILISEYTGLLYSVSISFSGHDTTSISIPNEEHYFTLAECIQVKRDGGVLKYNVDNTEQTLMASHILPFQVPRDCCTIESLLNLILSKKTSFCNTLEETLERDPKSDPIYIHTPKKTSDDPYMKTKHYVIKWNLDTFHEEENKLNASDEPLQVNTNNKKHGRRQIHSRIGKVALQQSRTFCEWQTVTLFVASVMALAVADYIQISYEGGKTAGLSYSQVRSARLAAEAVAAPLHGNLEEAARSIMRLAMNNKPESRYSSNKDEGVCKIQSRMCIIL